MTTPTNPKKPIPFDRFIENAKECFPMLLEIAKKLSTEEINFLTELLDRQTKQIDQERAELKALIEENERLNQTLSEQPDLMHNIQTLSAENEQLHNKIRAYELEIYGFDAGKKIASLSATVGKLRDALISIEEYWNGGEGSAVDAAEEMRFRAKQALETTPSPEVIVVRKNQHQAAMNVIKAAKVLVSPTCNFQELLMELRHELAEWESLERLGVGK